MIIIALHLKFFGHEQNISQEKIYSLKSMDYKTRKIKEQVN